MKRILILLMAVTACTRVPAPEQSGRILVSLAPPQTRAGETPAAEKRIWSAQFLVFDQMGTLCAWQQTTFPETTETYLAELTVPTGLKRIHVITNLAAPLNDIPDEAALFNRTFLLTENALVTGGDGGLIMAGASDPLLVTGTETLSCRIHVSRLVARVRVGTVRNRLPAGRQLSDVSLQLSNVPADRTLEGGNMPTLWCNKLLDKGGDLDAQAPVTGDIIASGGQWNCNASLFSFPNPVSDDCLGGDRFTPRKTRLVFSCTIGNTRYHYPVTLEELEQNTSYQVDLTLLRPGSTDPDVPVETGDIRFSIEPLPWGNAVHSTETL